MLRIALSGAGVALALVCGLYAPVLAGQSENSKTAEVLSLKDALARTLRHNPELKSFSLETRAREAEILQAGLRPNPVLSLELENVGGSGELSGVDAAESTLLLSQVIELGDKRARRRALAEAESALAADEYEIARVDVLSSTTRQFLSLLSIQERLKLAGEMVDLARNSLKTVEERIEGGKAAATEKVRASIILAELQVDRQRLQHQQMAARRELAALMGAATAEFGSLAGDLAPIPPPPALEELEKLVSGSSRIQRWMKEMERRDRALALEEARRVPDLEVGIGGRYEWESEDAAMVFGVSIPLPLFDRNQGSIAAARSRASQARERARDAQLQTRAAMISAWQDMIAAYQSARASREEILPAAQEAFEAAEYGYMAGKFGLLDVLDVQRTLIEARRNYVDSLTAYHMARTELARLLGDQMPKSFTHLQKPENNQS